MNSFKMMKQILIVSAFSAPVIAGPVSFVVTDNSGAPLQNAVVSLLATSAGAKTQAVSVPKQAAIMAQRDKQFDPHIVAVQKGNTVDFPNEDGIKHQVYSLSDLQQFEFLVNQGESVTGPALNSSGAINIGCNIHDWMLAYIYVADTPWFGTTDSTGKIVIDAPDGESFTWQVWHPRMPENETSNNGGLNTPSSEIKVKLLADLLPAYDEADDFDDFDDY